MTTGFFDWARRRQPAGLRASDIVNGYLWVLGRPPSPDEIRASLAYFAMQDNARRVFHSGLIISDEFRQRRIQAQQFMRARPVDLSCEKIVFLHIEKCGSTTLRTMLESQFAPNRVCPEQFNGLADWTANELAAYGLFAGHFDLSACRVVPGPSSIVTMLREPKARLLSLFNFWKAHRPHPSFDERTLVGLAQRHSAIDFFGHDAVVLHPSIRDAAVGQLTRRVASPILPTGFAMLEQNDPILAAPADALDAAFRALADLASFGLLEQFERSRVLFNHRLGLHMQPAEPRQALRSLVSPMIDANRPAPERPTPQLDAVLDLLTPLDQALYRRASALFAERSAALSDSAGGGARPG